MERNEPLVSIVTPVFNGELFIGEAIKSVISQSYTNWEYIIVENHSTDRTLEIAQSLADTDRRIPLAADACRYRPGPAGRK